MVKSYPEIENAGRSLLHQSRREPNGGLGSYGNGDGKRVLTGWRVVQGWGGGRS